MSAEAAGGCQEASSLPAVGAQLLDFVRDEARARDCRQLVLDTGLGMARAQRFYFRQGMLTRSIGFYEDLDAGDAT